MATVPFADLVVKRPAEFAEIQVRCVHCTWTDTVECSVGRGTPAFERLERYAVHLGELHQDDRRGHQVLLLRNEYNVLHRVLIDTRRNGELSLKAVRA